MDARQTSGKISVVDYLLKEHSRLFANIDPNTYLREEKARQIVVRMRRELIIYHDHVLPTDTRTRNDIDVAIKDWYPPEKARKKAESTRVSLHNIFKRVVQAELGYTGKNLFNKADGLRKKFKDDEVIQECCVVTGSGRSTRYKVSDPGKLEYRIRQLLKDDAGLKPHIQKVEAQKQAEVEQKAAETRVASRVAYELGGKKIDIYPPDFYSRENVLQILQLVHSSVFSEPRIGKIFDKLGENGRLKGLSLVEIINKTNGIMSLSSRSVQLKLESETEMNFADISGYLGRALCARYVHTLPGIIDEPYILKPELDGLVKTIEALGATAQVYRRFVKPVETPAIPSIDARQKPVEEVPDERVSVLNEMQTDLRKRGACPEGPNYFKLLKAEVLDESSEESIKRTYGAFAKEMEGYCFYNFGKIIDRMGIDWRAFGEGPMKRLIELGIAKDVVASLGFTGKRVNLYVLKKGKNNEMCKALSLDPDLFRRT